jgi:CRISPR/Cas system-associated protein Cas10 (large subunit of type III CRISPR-Cas system)
MCMEDTEMTTGTIPNDERCNECGAQPQQRTCSVCGNTALITDCGHKPQPRPIAAGRADGNEGHRDFCSFCVELPNRRV